MSAAKRIVGITRIYTGDEQQSHFEDLPIELDDTGTIGHLSRTYPASGIIFRETEGDYDFDLPNAPQRQYIILLEGQIEVTVGDGDKRRFQAADVAFVEDTEGQGHITRAVGGSVIKSIFITND